MNHTLVLPPEVATYVDLVRLYLGDLDNDTREELTGGLEADLAELVAEHGGASLPDPEEYADELRAAAGLPARVAARPRRAGLGWDGVNAVLDRCRARWLAWAGRGLRAHAWELVATLQPVWWLGRAWLAVMLLQMALSGQNSVTIVPDIGNRGIGVLLLIAATAVSIRLSKVGQGPDVEAKRRAQVRLVLLAVNGSLLLAAPYVQDRFENVLAPTAVVDDGGDDQVGISQTVRVTPP